MLINLDSDKIKHKVKWRGGFADRNDIFPISVDIQKESLDDRVRIRIYNAFMDYYQAAKKSKTAENLVNYFLQELYLTDYKFNSFYNNGSGREIFEDAIKTTIYKDNWANVFTFIEFWTNVLNQQPHVNLSYYKGYKNFERMINQIFEIEFVGYRLIDSKIVPITNDIEISAIEESLKNPSVEVKKHIGKALEKMSNRENPDYENSIKESISSVEAMANIITQGHNLSLGKALEQFEKKDVYIHPALKQAFKSLFGYTSDGTGIRHAGTLGGKDSTFEEAQFMLITCSAFNNYLLANQNK